MADRKRPRRGSPDAEARVAVQRVAAVVVGVGREFGVQLVSCPHRGLAELPDGVGEKAVEEATCNRAALPGHLVIRVRVAEIGDAAVEVGHAAAPHPQFAQHVFTGNKAHGLATD